MKSDRLNIALWLAQTLLAALFLSAGIAKFGMSAEELEKDFFLPAEFVRFIGGCEVFGALGLILPGILRFQTWLTPLAAAGLTVIMTGAVVVTLIEMPGGAFMPAIVGLVAAAVGYGRWRVAPLSERAPAVRASGV